MGRHLYVPAEGTRYLIRLRGSVSSSRETSLSFSATPFTLVAISVPPPYRDNHATGLSSLTTSPLRQSPYIFAKKVSLRMRPGSSFSAGALNFIPSRYGIANWSKMLGAFNSSWKLRSFRVPATDITVPSVHVTESWSWLIR